VKIVGKPLLTQEQIQTRVNQIAAKLSEDYRNKDIVAIGLLKGAFMFFSDLLRRLKAPVIVDFLIASSYEKTASTGKVDIYADIRENIKDRDVLLIEDIVDTGLTLSAIRQHILSFQPASLKICVFLDKKERRIKEVPLDYVGFEIPDEFVVGYGLDYENEYRNLPYVSIFKEKIDY
jgi:hypoxanthine phosphoribosyltransferase